jgi:hypothetical protein
MHTAMCINTAIAYPFYILPVLFPAKRWLGIAPVLFGMSQALGHGVIHMTSESFSRLAR